MSNPPLAHTTHRLYCGDWFYEIDEGEDFGSIYLRYFEKGDKVPRAEICVAVEDVPRVTNYMMDLRTAMLEEERYQDANSS